MKILLSVNTNKEFYIEAVNRTGGTAVAKYCPVYEDCYDGLILCGGNDISPERYGETVNGSTDIDEKRDEAEFELLKSFIAVKKPVMGICRGHQLINVALGGSLDQNIPDADLHRNKKDFYIAHKVTSQEGSICRKLYGEVFSVNSSHHQAIKNKADGLKITLTYGNVIEGFEHKTLPIFGVQFHPERMCFSQKREDTVDGAKIFEYFIGLCRRLKK